jgi:hypothetical protein
MASDQYELLELRMEMVPSNDARLMVCAHKPGCGNEVDSRHRAMTLRATATACNRNIG